MAASFSSEIALRVKVLDDALNKLETRVTKISNIPVKVKVQAPSSLELGKIAKDISGRLSSAAIGGAFPLLFGQSGKAAIGGAIGGLLGGKGGGFAGSLVGTLIGDLQAARDRVKELGAEMGFSAGQTQLLSDAFASVGRDADKLEAAVSNIRGLGLSVEETASALKLSVELAAEYGGKTDKIAQGLADVIESGKVNIASLNKFTAQGIPIQEELAEKYGVSRDKLLEMVKDGKVSVQSLVDELVDLGIEAEASADKGKTGFDAFSDSASTLALAIADNVGVILQQLIPALDSVLNYLSNIITQATRALSLLTDVQVGGANRAIFGAGFARGTGFGGKSSIDRITEGLRGLRPELANSQAELDKFRATARNAQAELGRYGAGAGDYALRTAQPELTRVLNAINKRSGQLGAAPVEKPTTITPIRVPGQLPPSGGGGGGGADAAAREEARTQKRLQQLAQETQFIKDQEAIKARIFAAELANDPLTVARLQGEEKLAEIQRRGADALIGETDARIIAATQANTLAKLDAQRADNARDLEEIQHKITESYTDAIRDLGFQLELEKAVTREEENQIKLRQAAADLEGKGFSQERINNILAATAALQQAQQPIQSYITQTQKWLNDTEAQIVSLAQSIETSISGAMAGAVEAMITGSKTVQEVLSEMFAQIGRAFLNMAAEIIAKQLVMITLQSILKALGAVSGGGGGGGGDSVSQFNASVAQYKFAEGGYVTGPTNAIIGEGGESEYVIPASKMSSAMANYNAGKRGSSVIEDSSAAGTSSGGGNNTFTLETVVINQVEYATVAQVREMGKVAANQGAQGGYTKTLSSMRNSRATRARLGMG